MCVQLLLFKSLVLGGGRSHYHIICLNSGPNMTLSPAHKTRTGTDTDTHVHDATCGL